MLCMARVSRAPDVERAHVSPIPGPGGAGLPGTFACSAESMEHVSREESAQALGLGVGHDGLLGESSRTL